MASDRDASERSRSGFVGGRRGWSWVVQGRPGSSGSVFLHAIVPPSNGSEAARHSTDRGAAGGDGAAGVAGATSRLEHERARHLHAGSGFGRVATGPAQPKRQEAEAETERRRKRRRGQRRRGGGGGEQK